MKQDFKFTACYAKVPLTVTETIKGHDPASIMRRAFTYGREMQRLTSKSIRVEAVA